MKKLFREQRKGMQAELAMRMARLPTMRVVQAAAAALNEQAQAHDRGASDDSYGGYSNDGWRDQQADQDGAREAIRQLVVAELGLECWSYAQRELAIRGASGSVGVRVLVEALLMGEQGAFVGLFAPSAEEELTVLDGFDELCDSPYACGYAYPYGYG